MNKNKDTPPRILFVLPSLYAGGAERVLITLMNGLSREQYAPALLSIQGEGVLTPLIVPDIPVYALNQNLSARTLPALFHILQKIKPDVVISTMAHMNFAVLALKPFFPKTRFIVREAITPSFLFEKHKTRSFIIKAIYKALYPLADIVLSPTQKVFDELSHDIGLSGRNFVMLKNPVHIDEIRKAAMPAPYEHTGDTIRFVACGRLNHQKGFDRLLDALQHLHTDRPWTLDILGEGEERSALETQIESNALKDKVFLRGLIMPPAPYFAAADCFLLPSRFEGLPNVALEALACGTPVIATQESGGIDEIARDCPEGNVRIVQDMKEFIAEANKIKPKTRQENGECAPSLLAQSYGQDSVFEHFAQILNGLR